VSPRSRGRKPKKSGKSKRTNKRPSPAAGRGTAVDPGYGGLGIELPRSPLDDVLTWPARPDRFGSSHRRVLAASAALLRAGGPRALEQATAELIGAELRNSEVQGLRFDLWAHDLIESARNRVLSDVAWNNATWQGPWWLLHGLASIGSYGLGGYAAQQAAEAAKSLPRTALAQQPHWLETSAKSSSCASNTAAMPTGRCRQGSKYLRKRPVCAFGQVSRFRATSVAVLAKGSHRSSRRPSCSGWCWRPSFSAS